MDVERIVRLAERMGASEAEATVSRSRYVKLEAHGGRIARATSGERVVVGVRVAVGRRVAGAGGDAEGGVERIVERAVSLARASREDEKWPGFNPRVGCGGRVRTVDPRARDAGPEELALLLAGEARRASELGGVIVEASLFARYGVQEYANSYGGPIREEGTTVSYRAEARVDAEGQHATSREAYYGVVLDTARIGRVTRLSVEHARDALRARTLPGPVRGGAVLRSVEAAGLIETLIVPAVSAVNIQRGRSPLAGRLGERVLSPSLSLVDDPFLDLEAGSACADDEGHPTSRKPVFDSGVFRTALYDHYHASLEGRESTGNGFRGTPWGSPSPAPTNLVVEHGGPARSVEDLAGIIGDGVIVVSTIGSWLSNPVSGQVNATVSLGYLVRRGSVEGPVKGAVMSGSIYEMLGDGYLGAGDDMECHGGVCTPSLAVRGASFS